MTIRTIIATIITFAGCVSASGTQPVDSLYVDSLREVTVVAIGAVKAVSQKDDGSAVVSRKGLSDAPSFMGSRDAVVVLRSMPAVATNNDLQATMHVKGGANGSNSYFADGMRVTNPLHMLGFYSAFNPAFFDTYDFRAGYLSADSPSGSGAMLEAKTTDRVLHSPYADASLGLIESHFAAGMPVAPNRLSLSIGGRMAYPSKIFPNLLELGTSSLKYGFWDMNLSLKSQVTANDMLLFAAFADRDNMDVANRYQGAKDGSFRWSNLAAGVAWHHGDKTLRVYWSQYRNKLFLDQGGRQLDLPSGLDQATVSWEMPLTCGWRIEVDVNSRRTLGQQNKALTKRNGVAARNAADVNAGAVWYHDFADRFRIEGGLRVSYYHTSGYNALVPQPRLLALWRFSGAHSLAFSYQRLVRFDRLIETSAGGLPSDFWTTASSQVRPDDVHAIELSLNGRIPWIGGSYRVEIYGKRLLHANDYAGSVLDLLSPSFDGSAQIVDASGWAEGVSVSLMRQFGRLRGRVGYNLGRTTLKSHRFGDKSYSAPYDRLHDLNISLTWQPLRWMQLSASYVYATGLPYTKAKYGYMIGENLICEYYPHNSSRLPHYNRLDLSASWHHTNRHGLRQEVAVSVYNVLGSHNVLFQYQDYSVSGGIINKSSVMNMVLPSITYSISFR